MYSHAAISIQKNSAAAPNLPSLLPFSFQWTSGLRAGVDFDNIAMAACHCCHGAIPIAKSKGEFSPAAFLLHLSHPLLLLLTLSPLTLCKGTLAVGARYITLEIIHHIPTPCSHQSPSLLPGISIPIKLVINIIQIIIIIV